MMFEFTASQAWPEIVPAIGVEWATPPAAPEPDDGAE
jgi:hypothetical protein